MTEKYHPQKTLHIKPMLALQKMKTPTIFEIKASDEEMEKVGNSETTVVEVMAGRKEARKAEATVMQQ